MAIKTYDSPYTGKKIDGAVGVIQNEILFQEPGSILKVEKIGDGSTAYKNKNIKVTAATTYDASKLVAFLKDDYNPKTNQAVTKNDLYEAIGKAIYTEY